MTSSILRSVVAAAAVLGLGAAAHAAILDLTLVANGAATGGKGTYGVYASVDNSSGFQSTGLASYQITLNTTSSPVAGPISSITNFSPKLTFTDSNGVNGDIPTGFTLLRSANSLTAGNPITGSEDTVSPTPILVYGFGLTAGNLNTLMPTAGYDGTSSPTQTTYGAPVLLAKGNFTGTPDGSVSTWFGTPTTGNLFIDNQGNTSAPDAVVLAVTGVSAIPEPASLGVLALGGVALLARRKKA